MMRHILRGFVVMHVALAAALLVAVPARAQSTPGDPRVTLALTTGASIGHEAGATLGGELSVRLTPILAVVADGAYLWNVTTSDVASRADIIGTAAGATADARQQAGVFDVAISARWPTDGRVRPYGLAGAGAVQMRTETTFARGGNAVAPEAIGISLGRDLDGSFTKPAGLVGGGIDVALSGRTSIDLGVRYHRHFGDPSATYERISIVRVQVAAGVRF